MAFQSIQSGGCHPAVQPCPLGHFTITVRDQDAPGAEKPLVANKTVAVLLRSKVDGTIQTHNVATSADGRITLHFAAVGDVGDYDYQVSCDEVDASAYAQSEPDAPKMRRGFFAPSGTDPQNAQIRLGTALIKGIYKIEYRYFDIGPAEHGVQRPPLLLRGIPIMVDRNATAQQSAQGPRTTDGGVHVLRADINAVQRRFSDKYLEPIPEGSVLKWRLRGQAAYHEVNLAAGAVTTTDGAVTVTAELLRVAVPNQRDTVHFATDITSTDPDLVVEIEFHCRFKSIFVVGEGFSFRYSDQLARRFEGGLRNGPTRGIDQGQAPAAADPADSCPSCRLRGPGVNPPPTTLPSRARRWIVASQYDIEPANVPGGTAALSNFIAYRDAVLQDDSNRVGRFDTRDQTCWNRLVARFPDLFDALVFNNPHPGYGMHYATVKGFNANTAHFASVHTLDYRVDPANLNTGLAPHVFNCVKQAPHTDGAAAQRNLVHGVQNGQGADGVRCATPHIPRRRLAHPLPGDFNAVSVFGLCDPAPNGTGPHTVAPGAAFRLAGQNLAYAAFRDNARAQAPAHYTGRAPAFAGLYNSIIYKYRDFGRAAVKQDGWLFLNGSSALERHAANAAAPAVMQPRGDWCDQASYQGQTYAAYPTNFTSARLHPSWLPALRSAGEPNLSAAQVFGWRKP